MLTLVYYGRIINLKEKLARNGSPDVGSESRIGRGPAANPARPKTLL